MIIILHEKKTLNFNLFTKCIIVMGGGGGVVIKWGIIEKDNLALMSFSFKTTYLVFFVQFKI